VRKSVCPPITVLDKYERKRARTLERGSESGSISDEDVQATKVCHGSGDCFLRLLDITHVGREGEYLCGRSLAQDRFFACVQRLLLTRDDHQRCASTREMQGCLEADAARCTSDQDDLPRKILRVVEDLWVDERINADNITVLALLQQAGHCN
jgi:hypothetical protein